jgi:hypothetical protein
LRPLNESKLSKNQGEIFKYQETYKTRLDQAYVEYYQELKDRSITDLVDYEIPFNMQERFTRAFDGFKKRFAPIISQMHRNMAGSTSATCLFNEERLNKFEIENYKVDFKKLK